MQRGKWFFILLIFGFIPTVYAESFSQYIASLRELALQKGVSKKTIEKTLRHVKQIDFRAIQAKAPRGPVISNFEQYYAVSVNEKRIQHGLQRLAQHHNLLKKISSQYHVPMEYIVAIWGLETDFGRLQGYYPEIDTLATMAYRSHRRHLFQYELLSALRIIDHSRVDFHKLQGSWAGAMGQCQFMPSTYLTFAVDYGKKGKKDIWHNVADVMASTANYLKHLHFNEEHPIVIPVKLPRYFPSHWVGYQVHRSLQFWNFIGVRTLNGKPLPTENASASIILPDGGADHAYLAYADNFHAIWSWNHSVYYAVSIGMLANKIAERMPAVEKIHPKSLVTNKTNITPATPHRHAQLTADQLPSERA